MVRTQIQLEEDQMQWLKQKALEKGVSISQLIREGLAVYRASEDRLPEDRKKRALTAVGRFESTISDISEKHDTYLGEVFAHGVE